MKNKEKRKATVAESLLAIFILILFAAVGNGVLGWNLNVMMMLAAGAIMVIAKICGYSYKDMGKEIAATIGDRAGILLLLLLIGALGGAFMVSGTVPVLVSWLGRIINPNLTVVLTFVLTSLEAWLVGSSFVSMGTMGVIMCALGVAQGLPIGLCAAAGICGGNFGQYLSPLGITVICAAESNKITPARVVKDMFVPTAIATVITVVYYFFMGRSTSVGSDVSSLTNLITEIDANFSSNILIVVPFVVAVVLSLMKFPSVPVLILSIISALLIGVGVQGYSLGDCIGAIYSGYSTEVFLPGVELSAQITSLLNRGGIAGMTSSMVFLTFALVCIAVMGQIGVFDNIQKIMFKKTENPGLLTLTTALYSLVLGAATTDVFPPMIICSQTARKPFIEAGQDPDRVASVSLGPAQWVYNVVPWSHVAIINGAFFGVALGEWVPFAIFLWLIPLAQVILSFLGIGNKPLPDGYVDTVRSGDE